MAEPTLLSTSLCWDPEQAPEEAVHPPSQAFHGAARARHRQHSLGPQPLRLRLRLPWLPARWHLSCALVFPASERSGRLSSSSDPLTAHQTHHHPSMLAGLCACVYRLLEAVSITSVDALDRSCFPSYSSSLPRGRLGGPVGQHCVAVLDVLPPLASSPVREA